MPTAIIGGKKKRFRLVTWPRQMNFDGKRYYAEEDTVNKQEAKRIAERLRRRGFYTRIIERWNHLSKHSYWVIYRRAR